MKNSKINTGYVIELIVAIATVLAIIVGSIAILSGSAKILKTFVSLATVCDNISFAQKNGNQEEDATWQEIRKQDFYESDDTLVRIYSNRNALEKIVIALLALVAIPAIIIMDGYYLNNIATNILKKINHARRAKAKNSDSFDRKK